SAPFGKIKRKNTKDQLPFYGRESVIEVCHNSQSLQRKVRMNHIDLRQSLRDQSRVATGRDDVDLLMRKLLCSNLRQDFANQSAIAEHGSRQHRLDCRFTDRAARLFQ